MAAGSVAGAVAALAVAEPSLERGAAFWVLLLICVALFFHLAAPFLTPPSRSLKLAIQGRVMLRKQRRAFREWVIRWFEFDALLRRAVAALSGNWMREDDEWKGYEEEYQKLRRYFQQHQWPFMAALSTTLRNRLESVPRPPSSFQGFHTHLEYELHSTAPFREFYAHPNLRNEVEGLAPDAVRPYSVDCNRHVRDFCDVMDRIEDVIREFATGLSVRVDEVMGHE